MLLSTGGSSDIYLLPRDDLSARFAALTLQAGEAGDRTLWDALKENPDGDLKDGVGIPNYIAEWPPIADFIDRLRGFPAVRATIKQQKEGVKARIAALSNSWATIISGSKAGQNLADFLITCRGPVANLQSADVSVTTKTCLEAYEKEQERAGGVWWSTLSRQIPAGVLLMFLLVTLGGLYRYNLRLAAFHDSRADVVQMVVLQTTPDQVRALMQGNPGEIFNRLALAFGAEKLDAGAMRVKLAEAEIQLAETAARLEAANS